MANPLPIRISSSNSFAEGRQEISSGVRIQLRSQRRGPKQIIFNTNPTSPDYKFLKRWELAAALPKEMVLNECIRTKLVAPLSVESRSYFTDRNWEKSPTEVGKKPQTKQQKPRTGQMQVRGRQAPARPPADGTAPWTQRVDDWARGTARQRTRGSPGRSTRPGKALASPRPRSLLRCQRGLQRGPFPRRSSVGQAPPSLTAPRPSGYSRLRRKGRRLPPHPLLPAQPSLPPPFASPPEPQHSPAPSAAAPLPAASSAAARGGEGGRGRGGSPSSRA